MQPKIIACEGCGINFLAKHGRTKYCTPKCCERHYYRKKRPISTFSKNCKFCKRDFIAIKSSMLCCSEYCRKRHRRLKAIAKLGGKCAHCGYAKDFRALQIDHVNNDGCIERKEMWNGSPAYYKRVIADTENRYQLLCANCHCIKTLAPIVSDYSQTRIAA